jgi:hypothetical protein
MYIASSKKPSGFVRGSGHNVVLKFKILTAETQSAQRVSKEGAANAEEAQRETSN